MAFETLTGIVLRYTDYRDNDRILTLLTRERGLVSVTARGVRSKGKTASGMVADRFCYGEIVVYERNNMLNTSSSSIIESFYPIREDYDRLLSAAQAAHMAEKLASNRPSDELFSLLYHTLSFIAYGEAAPKDLELCFAAKYLKLAGYEPVLTRCVCCGRSVTKQHAVRFSLANGGSVCDECDFDGRIYSPLALEALRRMLLLDDSQMDRVRLPEQARTELDRLIYEYAEYVLEQPLKLRTGKKQ